MKIMLLILLFTVYNLFPENGQAQTGASDTEQNVYRFVFRPGAELYEDEYQSNASGWKQIKRQFAALSDTAATSCYFLVESFVGEGEDTDEYLLNRAAFRGSIIRTLLRQRLGVSYDRVAFYMNRSGRMADAVQVSLMKSPMPEQTNRDIFFSFSSAKPDISRALSRYGQLPFFDLYYDDTDFGPSYNNMDMVADAPAPVAEKTKPVAQTTVTVAQKTKPVAKTTKPVAKTTEPVAQAAKPVVKTKKAVAQTTKPVAQKAEPAVYASSAIETEKPGARPLNLTVKTNLLPWLGLVPAWTIGGKNESGYASGPLMYNGAVEYCFARRYSVEFSFLYAYSSFGGRKDNLWGISSFELEPRLWLSDNNRFRGFNVGFRVGYGDFDIRNNKPENYGRTGRFYSAGFTLGYTLPVYSTWLLAEGRVYAGYRNAYDGKEYRYSPAENKNYYESSFSQGNWLVGASVNILFRCGFRK